MVDDQHDFQVIGVFYKVSQKILEILFVVLEKVLGLTNQDYEMVIFDEVY